jgi:uncharacterized tellurite resistance protein B-like protein
MLDRLRLFFAAADDRSGDNDEAVLHLAAAVLLVEVAKADHALDEAELARLEQVLADHWGLGKKDLADLVRVAHDTAEADTSLHTQIDLINRRFTRPQKLDLMRGLWEVACADGVIHHHEELLIRRLADLIYVSHTDFIRTKHLALDNG